MLAGVELGAAVRRRRMVRSYTDEPVEADQLERILELAGRAPSAGFSQGQSFVVVAGPDDRQALLDQLRLDAPLGGRGVWSAPVFVVVCTSERVYRDRYMEPDKRLADGTSLGSLPWPVPYWWVDAGASMMLLLLAVVDEGLGACFFGLGPDRWAIVRQHLAIPDTVETAGIVAIGHPAPDVPSPSLQRGWRSRDELVHRGRW